MSTKKKFGPPYQFRFEMNKNYIQIGDEDKDEFWDFIQDFTTIIAEEVRRKIFEELDLTEILERYDNEK